MAHIEQFLKVAARMTAVDNKRAADQRQLDLENALAYARTAAQVSETDKADIEAKQRAIAMARDFATSALRRASEYASKEGEEYVCPVCWVKEAIKVRLGTAGDSHLPPLVCPECNAPFFPAA